MGKQFNSGKDQITKQWLEIESYADLIKHEKEIVDRIGQFPNGGHLFLIHPFMLLKDIGVKLSKRAEQEILKQEPRISGLSEVPYNALKSTKEKQRFHVRLHGLFERREK